MWLVIQCRVLLLKMLVISIVLIYIFLNKISYIKYMHLEKWTEFNDILMQFPWNDVMILIYKFIK